MLIARAIQIVHTLSQGDASYPTSGEDDYALILEALNTMVNQWESEKSIDWNELFTTETGSIVTDDPTYSLSENVKWPAGLLLIDGRPVNYQKPNESHLTQAVSPNTKRFFVSGPVGAKVLNVLPAPSSEYDGATWTLPCYNAATYFTTGEETDPIEMRDPYFAIHGAISLISIEDNPTLAGVHQQMADNKLEAMRIANDLKPIGSKEDHYDETYAGFGT